MRAVWFAGVLAGALTIAGCSGGSMKTTTATPTFTPPGGTYGSSQTVTVSDTTAGAVLYCTTDGSAPSSSSSQCTQPMTISQTETLSALAVAPGDSPSAVASATYTINLPKTATPAFSPAAGTYNSVQTVTISDTTTGAAIYYTTDGSTPTASSTQYSAPISVSASETINAIAVASGYANSAVATAAYTITGTTQTTPTISSLSPASATAGGAAFTLTVNGANFLSGAIVNWNGTALTTTYKTAAQLTAAVPASLIATAGAATVTVSESGVVSAGAAFTINAPTAPTITTLSPTSGAVGASVTITGTNFGASQGSSTVTFNNTAATVTSWSASSITTTVPTGATSGNVVVTVNGTASNGVAFTVTSTAPSITTLSPTSGAVGASVTITGTNFGASQGSSTVTFNNTAATVTSWSASSITTTVPTGATSGNVVVTVNGTVSNGVAFTVSVPAPTITTLSPTSGAAGTSITITGTGFGASQGSSTVAFGGTTATATSWSDTSIVTTVPTGATVGNVNVVVTVNGTASNGVAFTVGASGPLLTGTVLSSTTPIVKASVQLYAAGTTGYGGSGTGNMGPTLLGSAVQSGNDGTFSLTLPATCPAAPGDLLYLVATGGSFGSSGSANNGIALMTALGACSNVSASTTVTINEVTTVASAYALAGFSSFSSTGPGIAIGAPAPAATCATGGVTTVGGSSCNYLGMANAFRTVNNLVNVFGTTDTYGVAAGTARTITPFYSGSDPRNPTGWSSNYGDTYPNGAVNSTNNVVPADSLNTSTVPQARINALADILASCVESLDGSGCATLFPAATPTGGTTPADTLQAALNIAQNPGSNGISVAALLGLVPATNPPYATVLDAGTPPTDLTLALTFTGAGLGIDYSSDASEALGNYALVIDGGGNLWISAYASSPPWPDTGMIAGFDPLGEALTPPTSLVGGSIFVDETNLGNSSYGGFGPNYYDPKDSGLAGLMQQPFAFAIDPSGNLWEGENDSNHGNELAISPSAVPVPPSSWFPISSLSVVTEGPGVPVSKDYLAIDGNGSVWETGNGATTIQFVTSDPVNNGQYTVTGANGGLFSLTFDSNGSLWAVGSNSTGTGLFDTVPSSGTTLGGYNGVYTNSLAAGTGGNMYACNLPQLAPPTFNLPTGTYSSPQMEYIQGNVIIYTTDGSDPNTSPTAKQYTNPIVVSTSEVINAINQGRSGSSYSSPVASVTITISGTPAPPNSNPIPNNYPGSYLVFNASKLTGPTATLPIPSGYCGASLTVDGAGNLWSINSQFDAGTGNYVDALEAVNPSTQTLITPDAGYTGSSSAESAATGMSAIISGANIRSAQSQPGLVVDGSGNLWFMNPDVNSSGGTGAPGNNALVEFIGVAAPTVTPTSIAVQNAAQGTKP
ncbi:beta strand repeat-containing protein [Paracidobacterium acidisoli]|nr:IPT/TIG domain-containing protein [Paracidobacterium acidisoli]MBT9333100.1 IPT/TIG domain-containing protein [Paracidobacterium acidisoli]